MKKKIQAVFWWRIEGNANDNEMYALGLRPKPPFESEELKAMMKNASQSETRIILLKWICGIVRVPSIAVRCDGGQVHSAWDIGDSLEELDAESLGDVPSDMAMEEPCPGIVGVECDDDPTKGWKHGNITSHGVVEVKGGRIG